MPLIIENTDSFLRCCILGNDAFYGYFTYMLVFGIINNQFFFIYNIYPFPGPFWFFS